MSHARHVAAAVLAGLPFIGPAAPAVAQNSASATIDASLTVMAEISVTGAQNMLFGTHFPSEGTVNAQDGEWLISGSPGTVVDLSFTMLPDVLSDGSGNEIPLIYGTTSLSVYCDDGTGNTPAITLNPATGFSGCTIPNGNALVELSNGLGGDGRVTAVVDGAPPGTYTAVIELTAIVN